MASITVVTPFLLTRDDGTQQAFGIGTVEVDDAVANHWYVKAHCEVASAEAAAPAGADTDALLARAQAVGLAVDKRWSAATLQAKVEEAEKAKA